jgi:putative DNA primase/helicase
MDAIYAQPQNTLPFEETVEVNSSANDKAKTSRKGEIIINIHETPRLNEQADKALEALKLHNEPPTIFKRGGSLCRLDEIADGEFVINQINKGALKGILAEAARWTKWEEKDDGEKFHKDVYPPAAVAEVVISYGDWPVPWLNGITNTPIIRSDGSIFNEQGFDDRTGYFYIPDEDFDLPEIPENPTKEDAEKAARYLAIELFSDFPFVDEASAANALAATITPVARTLIDGCIPLCLISKPSPGTGASLFVIIISLVARGKEANFQKDPRSEEEWQKTLLSSLLKGSPIVCFDNVDSNLSSSALANVLTAPNVEGRILGKSEMVSIPNSACWYANGNNLEVAGDLGRRSYLVQMDAKEASPWERDPTEFRHQELKRWIMDNRGPLVAAALTMITAWIIAGKPKAPSRPMGSFEEWAETLGGILYYAGVKGFRENDEILQKKIDVGNDQWTYFLNSWNDKFGDSEKTAREIADWAIDADLILPEEIDNLIKYNKINSSSLGKILKRKLDRPFSDGLILKGRNDAGRNMMFYKIEKRRE